MLIQGITEPSPTYYGGGVTIDPVILLITSIITSVIAFIIRTWMTKWYAGKRDWDDSWRTALIVNILWFIVSLVIGMFLPATFLWSIIILLINLVLGTFVVKSLYDKEFGESFTFVIVVLILTFIVAFIIGIIIGFIIAAVLIGTMI